ncbi:unnamed protein product [Angiostrongylus costaricensis]|nr:unnamed protein product [Angiostrongylus costaricensis]
MRRLICPRELWRLEFVWHKCMLNAKADFRNKLVFPVAFRRASCVWAQKLPLDDSAALEKLREKTALPLLKIRLSGSGEECS